MRRKQGRDKRTNNLLRQSGGWLVDLNVLCYNKIEKV